MKINEYSKINPLITPILFIVFNRPDSTEKVFNEIRRAKPKQLFIAADGPRSGNNDDKINCKKVRKIITNVDWDCEVKTLFRENNLGCKYAVSGAIDWFFENIEEGIILEDDCLPSQSFFWYCQDLLKHYRNDKRIFSISGNSFFNKRLKNNLSYHFFKIPLIWGWATWKRSWNFYDVEISKYKNFKKTKTINNIFSKKIHRLYFDNLFNETYNGNINTWDYQWAFTCLINNGLTCVPNNNLVINIGFSQNATHTKKKPKNIRYISSLNNINFPLNHPEYLIKNYKIENSIFKNHFQLNSIFFIKYIIIKLLKILK